MTNPFDYHTELHHSQTDFFNRVRVFWFDYHTELHHSQTNSAQLLDHNTFDYHTELHHSQTAIKGILHTLSLTTIQNYTILKRNCELGV